MTEEEFQAFCVAELGRFSEVVQQLMASNIDKFSKGPTRDSIRTEVVRQVGQYLAVSETSFAEAGRFMEMKQLRHGSLPPVQPILDWVKSRGVSAFAYTPGYNPSWKVPTDDQKALRIAWAMRYHIKEKLAKRPQKWWSKDFYRSINVIINNVANGYKQHVGMTVIANFKTEI